MCKKTQFKYCPSTIDKCIRPLIKYLNSDCIGIITVASCCGHRKYPMTIVVTGLGLKDAFEVLSSTVIPRKTRFYHKDREGYYYIPEVMEKLRLPTVSRRLIKRRIEEKKQ